MEIYRKQELEQESDQENKKKKERKHALDPESAQEKKKTFFFSWSSSCFLVFFYKFPPLMFKINKMYNENNTGDPDDVTNGSHRLVPKQGGNKL